jgi:hypothetical protein
MKRGPMNACDLHCCCTYVERKHAIDLARTIGYASVGALIRAAVNLVADDHELPKVFHLERHIGRPRRAGAATPIAAPKPRKKSGRPMSPPDLTPEQIESRFKQAKDTIRYARMVS